MKIKLYNQLTIIIFIIFIILVTSLLIVLPNSLEPFFENSVYTYLDKPLQIYEGNNTVYNIGFIIVEDNTVYTSNNLSDIGISNYSDIKDLMIDNEGKFSYNSKTYFYSKSRFKNILSNSIKIAITDDTYINTLSNNLKFIVFPIVIITFTIILSVLLIWCYLIVKKTNKLKEKIDNINNKKYNDKLNTKIDDELTSLDNSIDKVKKVIIDNDKYKSEMYQNVSHDFKTPIAVIKSYSEAYFDKIETADNALEVINKQTIILQDKVRQLLELNKITYLENTYEGNKNINIDSIIIELLAQYKYVARNIKFIYEKDNDTVFDGTIDIWEPIINNILSNFTRYAKNNIKIEIKDRKITFYNDGKPIEKSIVNSLFEAYKKGSDGKTGLGLSIVKRNLDIINYKIEAKNKKDGVYFIISKKS